VKSTVSVTLVFRAHHRPLSSSPAWRRRARARPRILIPRSFDCLSDNDLVASGIAVITTFAFEIYFNRRLAISPRLIANACPGAKEFSWLQKCPNIPIAKRAKVARIELIFRDVLAHFRPDADLGPQIIFVQVRSSRAPPRRVHYPGQVSPPLVRSSLCRLHHSHLRSVPPN